MNSITIVIDKKNSFNSNNNNIYKKKKINNCLFLIKKILNNLFMVYKKTFYSYKDISEEDNFNANNSSKEINNSDIIKKKIITLHFQSQKIQ